MTSRIHHLLLITVLTVVFSEYRATLQSLLESDTEWFCPPGQVLLKVNNKYWCFKGCTSCPNGFCKNNECHCFPGMRRDSKGICGKICPNCENGWCSSVLTCECNAGFTLMQGRCVRNYNIQSTVLPPSSYQPVFNSTIPLSYQPPQPLSYGNPPPQYNQGHNYAHVYNSAVSWSDIVRGQVHTPSYVSHSNYPTQMRSNSQPQVSSRTYPQTNGGHPIQLPSIDYTTVYYSQNYPELPRKPSTPTYIERRVELSQSPKQSNVQNSRPTNSRAHDRQLNVNLPTRLPLPQSPGSNQEVPPRRDPPASSAGHSDHPYQFEKIDPQFVVQRRTPTRSCQIDYVWDRETNACIPYESASFGIDIRSGI